jgi:hypothetical protein
MSDSPAIIWIEKTELDRLHSLTKDLLAALKFLCDEVENEGEHGPAVKTYEDDCPICVGLQEAREAIAKAEKQI